jgi:hypothetical protein
MIYIKIKTFFVCLLFVGWQHCFSRGIAVAGNDHKVEFHDIEIQLFLETEIKLMRSKLRP